MNTGILFPLASGANLIDRRITVASTDAGTPPIKGNHRVRKVPHGVRAEPPPSAREETADRREQVHDRDRPGVRLRQSVVSVHVFSEAL